MWNARLKSSEKQVEILLSVVVAKILEDTKFVALLCGGGFGEVVHELDAAWNDCNIAKRFKRPEKKVRKRSWHGSLERWQSWLASAESESTLLKLGLLWLA